MSGPTSAPLDHVPITLLIEEGKDYYLEPGCELPYRHRRNLGFGHSGNVEEIEDMYTGAVFARKTIRFYGPRDRAERRRVFENEVKIIRSLDSHRHIIRVFATYATKREVGLILQPVADEGDLHDFLEECREDTDFNAMGVRQLADARFQVLQRAFGCLLSGLEFMHKKRIRHKDIKPQNILVHRGLTIYTDFGYSFNSGNLSSSASEGRPSFLTRRYSAPEVLDHSTRNSMSDIFSLGCVFIEILSVFKHLPIVDKTSCFSEELRGVRNELEKTKSDASNTFLAEVSQICLSMTAADTADRSSASQILEWLSKYSSYFCKDCQQLIRPPTNEMKSNSKTSDLRSNPSLPLNEQHLKFSSVHKITGSTSDSRLRGRIPDWTCSFHHIAVEYDETHFTRLGFRKWSQSSELFEKGTVIIVPHILIKGLLHNPSGGNQIEEPKECGHQVRYFVIVDNRDALVRACQIVTYRGRGSLKSGYRPEEHAAIHCRNERPMRFEEEHLKRLPIAVELGDPMDNLHGASRIWYRKAYPIDTDVIVKHGGSVVPHDLERLLADYREVSGCFDRNDSFGPI